MQPETNTPTQPQEQMLLTPVEQTPEQLRAQAGENLEMIKGIVAERGEAITSEERQTAHDMLTTDVETPLNKAEAKDKEDRLRIASQAAHMAVRVVAGDVLTPADEVALRAGELNDKPVSGGGRVS